MPHGLDSTGFTRKRTDEILSDIAARQHASPALGPNQDISPASPLGQINASVTGDLALLWELAELVYQSIDPDGALDVPLENVASLTGTTKRAASASRVVNATLNLDAGITVPAGSTVSVDGRPDLTFTLDADVTNSGGSPANVSGDFTCTQTGPIVVNPGTLTEIDTPVVGWNSVTNPSAAIVGRPVDSNVVLRQRRVDQLALRGGSTVAAIKADLLDVESTPEFADIEDVEIIENRFGFYDADGLPPNSFETLVDDNGAVNGNLIAQAIWDSKPAGIEPFGTGSGLAYEDLESETGPHIVYYSIVDRKEVYIEYGVTIGPGFPVDGHDQIAAAMAARGANLDIGADVIALYIRDAAFGVPGVVDVPMFFIGFAANPTNEDNLAVSARERAVFAVDRITQA